MFGSYLFTSWLYAHVVEEKSRSSVSWSEESGLLHMRVQRLCVVRGFVDGVTLRVPSEVSLCSDSVLIERDFADHEGSSSAFGLGPSMNPRFTFFLSTETRGGVPRQETFEKKAQAAFPRNEHTCTAVYWPTANATMAIVPRRLMHDGRWCFKADKENSRMDGRRMGSTLRRTFSTYVPWTHGHNAAHGVFNLKTSESDREFAPVSGKLLGRSRGEGSKCAPKCIS